MRFILFVFKNTLLLQIVDKVMAGGGGVRSLTESLVNSRRGEYYYDGTRRRSRSSSSLNESGDVRL